MAYITPDALAALRLLQQEQDHRALLLGVMTLRWLEQARQTSVDVLRWQEEQKRAGEATLRAHGFEPAAEDLTVDLASGQILRLVAGAWQATE